jgi:hypothetical protein
MRKLLFIVLLLTGHVAFPQSHSIKGKVIEKEAGALPSASVLLMQTSDSAVVYHTTTSTGGFFLIDQIKNGNYIFKVSFLSFAPYFKNLTIPSNSADTLQLGTIALEPVVSELKEITVIAPRAPVVVKEDTVEYNAGSFTTQPNANVERLLKKLPGVDVESDGNISVQGERVTRIFVDGKEFFGGDIEMATKNLPADAIDKVQVIDEKSEEARFSGIDDGQREKVINLTLKEDRRSMGFGKATAGVGTDKRYMAQANYNRFQKGNQLSVMGMSNNVNNQGLSADGSGGTGDRQNGLVNTHTGGLNFLNQLSKKTTVNGSYRFNNTDATIQNDLTRQNFLPEGTAKYYENSQQHNQNKMHQANTTLESKDSLNTIKLNTIFSFSDATSRANSSRQSFSVADVLVNEGERNVVTQNKNSILNTRLFYGHHFHKRGRSFTVTNQFNINNYGINGNSNSFTRFSQGAKEAIKQRNKKASNNMNFSMRFAYTEPLGKKQYLQAHYDVSDRHSKTNLEVFDIINEASEFNTEQSSRFRSGYLYQQAGLTYHMNRNNYNLAIGSSVQIAELSRRLQGADNQVKQSFRNILPSVNYRHRITRNTRLNFIYTTSVKEPSIQQLQPVVLRYDPLNLYMGNTDLRPEYTHQGKLTINSSAATSGIFLAGSVTYNYTTNPITAAVTIDENQVRSTQYVNVRQKHNFSAFLNLGIPVEKYNSRFNLSPLLNTGQSINLLNGVVGTIKQRSVGGKMGFSFSYKEYLDLNFRTNMTVTSADYESNQDQVFFTSAYIADATVYFLKHFSITTELNYNKFKNTTSNFDQAIPILDFSLSMYILKDNKGEIKISGLNVLNRNTGATQLASLNYIEQAVQNTLGNYYMLNFTYNLNKNLSD